MRRPSVHRVEVALYKATGPGEWDNLTPKAYRTRCGITGGAELLRLEGTNNGTSHWCGGCYPSSIIDPRSTSRWESRWTRG